MGAKLGFVEELYHEIFTQELKIPLSFCIYALFRTVII